MRSSVRIARDETRGGGYPPGIPSEHLDNLYLAGQRTIVGVDVPHGAGEEARRGGVAGRVVRTGEIVVDGLRNADDRQSLVHVVRAYGDLLGGLHRPVAARIEERPDVTFPEDRQQPLEIGGRHGAARAAEGRSWRLSRCHEPTRIDGPQIDEVFRDDAVDPVPRAEERPYPAEPARLVHETNQAGVDDGGRAAAVRDERIAEAQRYPRRRRGGWLMSAVTRPPSRANVPAPSSIRP